MQSAHSTKSLQLIGWREWLTLPDLGVAHIKAKVDTGARSSALHAKSIKVFHRQGKEFVRFMLYPHQDNTNFSINCEAAVIDKRTVTDSGGHEEQRFLIQTSVTLGDEQWQIAVSLTNRKRMGFRMLLGRKALENLYLVDVSRSFIYGEPEKLNI